MEKWDIDKVKSYIQSQDWYQTIELSKGFVTPGTTDSRKRLKFFEHENFQDKSVLDIGCNSGFYCLWAKKKGAKRVVGIDISEKRIEQAKILTEIEGLDIEFYNKGIFEIKELGKFDIVFCFAVITEIENMLSALEAIRKMTNQKAYIELALAKPLVYFSTSKYWIKGFFSKKYSRGIIEMRPTKVGYMLCPSLKIIKDIFAEEFIVKNFGKSVRYDLIILERRK